MTEFADFRIHSSTRAFRPAKPILGRAPQPLPPVPGGHLTIDLECLLCCQRFDLVRGSVQAGVSFANVMGGSAVLCPCGNETVIPNHLG